MLFKALAIFALVAAVNGGYLADIGAQSEHTVRGYGGLSSVSQFSKAIDGPFSSVRKTDTRVTNSAIGAYGYAAPAYAASPALAVAHHGYAAPALAVAHNGYAANAAYGHQTYSSGPALAVAHHGYAAPALGHAYAAPAIGHAYAGAIGHHYSAVSPAVATLNFNGYGLGSYAY